MVDHISPERRSLNMSRIASANTKPEVLVRSLLHGLGFRFRKNVNRLPGKPDIVLKKHHAVIFVHGCFWHKHVGCKRSNIPKSNIDYWKPKLDCNAKRDESNIIKLGEMGWKVLVVWECEVKDLFYVKKRLLNFLPPQFSFNRQIRYLSDTESASSE